jgi:hypothetical protein
MRIDRRIANYVKTNKIKCVFITVFACVGQYFGMYPCTHIVMTPRAVE